MLSTTEITNRSFQLYKQNWKPMLIAGFISFAITQLADISVDGEIGTSLLELVLGVLIAPIAQGGYYFYQMNVWSEKPSSVKDILYFLKSVRSFGKALWFFFCYSIVTSVAIIITAVIPILYIALLGGAGLDKITLYFAALIILIPFFWLMARFILSPYLYIGNSEEGVFVIIAKSFEMMKGYIGKLILIILMSTLIELVYFIPEFIIEEAGLQSGAASAILFVLHLLVYPLTSMMMAGFACEVLREHGVITDESAELVEEDNESYVLHDDEAQDAVIVETKEDNVYYD